MISLPLLRQFPMFAEMDDAAAARLCELAQLVEAPRRHLIVEAGSEGDGAYLLISGKVKVFLADEDGREVILGTLGPGEVFGEMSLIDDLPCSAHVETKEACTLARLAKTDFLDCLDGDSRLARAVMRNLAMRLRQADAQIEQLALFSVEERVLQCLIDHSTVVGKRRELLPPSKQDIARMVGASREMVSRVMRALEDSGRIEMHGKTLVITASGDTAPPVDTPARA
jgi:CRP/FNR family cyclic AMP-dependent transcriptional regulator